MEVRAKDLGVDQIWHRAYHGTHTGSVASIFRAGNIFAAGVYILLFVKFNFISYILI